MKALKKIKSYLKTFNFWVDFVLILCALGLFRNFVFLNNYSVLGRDMESAFIAMIALYLAQIILILLKQWTVWIISLLQVIFCIYVYPDFSLLPFMAVIKFVFFNSIIEKSYAWANFINFMFVSLGFSTEILKTYLLYVYFPKTKAQK